jgi:hypothetical protein
MLSIKNKILPAIIILLSISTGYLYWKSRQIVNVGYLECRERYGDCYQITTYDSNVNSWHWGNNNPNQEDFSTEREAVLNCVLSGSSFN